MTLSRREFFKRAQGAALGLSAVSLASAMSFASEDATQPPNVILILADDLGWGDLNCYGHSYIKTPALDRLAKQGTRFTHAYMSGSVCSPARASLTTGKYPARLKMHGHLGGRELNQNRAMPDWLDPKEMTLARLLKQNGYATAMIGKWHLGSTKDSPVPAQYGFDYTATATSNDPNPISIWAPEDRPFATKTVMDEALKFIQQNKDKPFYVNAWLTDPHGPLNPNKEQMDEYAWAKPSPDLDHEGAMRVYFGTVTEMDKQIGLFLDKLEAMGLAENTIVIFTSDNGPEDIHNRNTAHSGIGSSGPFRGVKRSLYEGGIRVPMIVRWPGKTPANAVDNQSIVTGVDFMPSICKLAGVKLHEGLEIDGIDMSDAFLGKSKKRGPHHWEWRFAILGKQVDLSPTLAMRDGDWKLLMNADESRVELYNVVRDPSELDNKAEEEPQRTERMKKDLLSWHKTLPQGPSDPGAGSNEYPWPSPLN